MHIWVTRPMADAGALRAKLIAHGHEVTLEPLLTIEFLHDEPIELDGVQALIATSRNALRAIAGRPEIEICRSLPLFVVGRGTAQAAKSLGFETIIEGPSTARALLALIVNVADVNEGALVHLAGETVAFNLCEELRRLGYHVFQPILYRSIQAQELSEPLLRQLHEGRIEAVVLLSGRTAEAYAKIMNTPQNLGIARRLVHFCLSEAVATKLSPLQPINVKLSYAPNIDEMLALIG